MCSESNESITKELERAVSKQNLEEVKVLLSEDADVIFRVIWNRNRLPGASTRNIEITQEFLLADVEVNVTNNDFGSALQSNHDFILIPNNENEYARTQRKKLELIRELLKHGATNHKGINLEVVEDLLEYGADINIRNRARQFCNAYSIIDNTANESIECTVAVGDFACAKLLIKLTLIRNFNTDYENIIDLAPYKQCRNYSELSSYLDGCVSEILQMKRDAIKDGLPLYELVTNNFNLLLLRNNQLSVRLAKIDYSVRYPIYNDIILNEIKPFLERADLLNKLSKIQFYTQLDIVNQDVEGKRIILDHDSIYNITEYLSNYNLLNLIVAFDNNNLVEPGTRLEISTSNAAKRVRLEE